MAIFNWGALKNLKKYSWLSDDWIAYASGLDFCIFVLNCNHNSKKWNIFKSIVEDCGIILPYENICIICDRPTKISFDDRNILHAEGEPAIQYADGYSLYAYHGVTIPEKYGKFYPSQWRSN